VTGPARMHVQLGLAFSPALTLEPNTIPFTLLSLRAEPLTPTSLSACPRAAASSYSYARSGGPDAIHIENKASQRAQTRIT